jgi:hypothetical protein
MGDRLDRARRYHESIRHVLLRKRDPIGVADEPAAQGCKAARNRFLIGLDMTLRPRERPMVVASPPPEPG